MVSSIIWLQLADLNDLTRRNGEQGFGAGRHEGQQIPHAIGFCTEDDDGYLPPGHVLLVLDPAVAGEQTSHRPSASERSSPFFFDP